MGSDLNILLIQIAPENPGLYINKLPPIGLLQIVSYLESKNYNVDVVDANIDNIKIKAADYQVIGFSVNLANISSSLNRARNIKNKYPNIKIIVGGPSCISNPEFFCKQEYIDAVCATEGEEVMHEYIEMHVKKGLNNIPGAYIRIDGQEIIYGGKRAYIEHMDNLPFPAFNKVNLSKYIVPLGRKRPVSSISTSRGCPNNCSFCFHSMGWKWRARSPENVFEEIKWQVLELGVREICVQDDNFLLDKKRAELLFDYLIAADFKVGIQIHNGMRIESLDYEFMSKMRKAGVWLVALCPETASPKVMKEIKKEIDVDKYRQIIDWCRKLKIFTYTCFIFGFPFEEKEDLLLTKSFIESIDTDVIHITRALPIPGTGLYERYADRFKDKDFSKEEGMLYGNQKLLSPNISEEEFNHIIKTVYRNVYLNPKRAVRLLFNLPIANLWRLFKYAILTDNI